MPQANVPAATTATTTSTQTLAETVLNAVACPTVTTCVAVGVTAGAALAYGEGAYSADGGVVVTITNGVPGTVQQVPVPSQLSGIACPTATLCEAVGSGTQGSPAGSGGILVAISPGAAQEVQSVTQTGTAGLGAIACANSTTCEAVVATGTQNTDGQVVTIVNSVAGAPQAVHAALAAVACPTSTTCEAVGTYNTSSGYPQVPGQNYVVTITNGVAGPAQAVDSYVYLSAIACPTTTTCEAVGAYSYGYAYPSFNAAVVPIVNGVAGVPQLSADTRQLRAIACSDAATCRAVGDFTQAGAPMVPIVGGVPDAVETIPGTSSYSLSPMRGIACPSATTCLAVGSGVVSIQGSLSLIVSINPGTPAAVPPPIANFYNPRDGDTAVDTNNLFAWTTVPAAQAYRITGGMTPGGSDLFDSGVLPPPQDSFLEPVMPAGPTIYGTISTELDGTWRSQTIRFIVAQAVVPFSPTVDGATGVDPTRPFNWKPIPQAQGYILVVGTTHFGTNLVNSGILPPSQTSYLPPVLPPNTTLYATLLTKVNGAFTLYQAETFTTGPVGATLIGIANGETGTPTTVMIAWAQRAQGQAYDLVIGTTKFGTNVFSSGVLAPGQMLGISHLPAGKVLYATLLTEVHGIWYFQAITFAT